MLIICMTAHTRYPLRWPVFAIERFLLWFIDFVVNNENICGLRMFDAKFANAMCELWPSDRFIYTFCLSHEVSQNLIWNNSNNIYSWLEPLSGNWLKSTIKLLKSIRVISFFSLRFSFWYLFLRKKKVLFGTFPMAYIMMAWFLGRDR